LVSLPAARNGCLEAVSWLSHRRDAGILPSESPGTELAACDICDPGCRVGLLFLKLQMGMRKRTLVRLLSAGLLSIGSVGCSEKFSVKTEMTTAPTGMKTVTHETEIQETETVDASTDP
jgi:hypothetical protein